MNWWVLFEMLQEILLWASLLIVWLADPEWSMKYVVESLVIKNVNILV